MRLNPKTVSLVGATILTCVALLQLIGAFDRSTTPRPGSAPIHEISGQLRPTNFEVAADTEADLKALWQIAQSNHRTRDGVSEFEREETRIELEAILSGAPDLFHAKSLLATWHAMNGNTERALEYRNAALEEAPIVLTIPVRFSPTRLASGIQLESISIEHNRMTRSDPFGGISIDPSIQLGFINVTSDREGNIRLPVYDTVYRLNSWSHPRGLHADMRSLGWFKSKRREGVMPTLWIWDSYAPAPDLERTAQQSSHLKNAEGTQGATIKGRLLTFARTVSTSAHDPADKPVDRATIQIGAEGDGTFEIDPTSIHFLESKTKIPLHRFQSGAGFQIGANAQLELFSFWNPLPASVDLVFEAYEYKKGAPPLALQPQAGATATFEQTTITLDSINAGQHQSWNSTTGYSGEISDRASRSELILSTQMDVQRAWTLWIVDSTGRKRLESRSVYLQPNTPQYVPLSIGLDRIARIELRPRDDNALSRRLFFEDIPLPNRPTDRLPEPKPVEFSFDLSATIPAEPGGVVHSATSQAWAPIHLGFTVRSNQHIISTSWSNDAYSVEYQPAGTNMLRPFTLYEWETNARFDVQWMFELIDPNSHDQLDLPIRSQSSGTSFNGSFQARGFNISAESVSAARLQMQPMESGD